jgi:hypothetical protein
MIMATSTQLGTVRHRIESYPASNLKLDLLVSVLIFYFLCGLFLDGWAHNHGRVDNTFLTPWHAVLYSAFGLVGLTFVITQFMNVLKGHTWTRALPKGYGLGLIGVMIFAVGGGFDFWWHSTFGFEADVEALLSPAHMLLLSGALLFATVPLRAAWMRKGTTGGWAKLFPAMLSLICLFMVLTFFTQYSHYIGNSFALVEDPGRNSYITDVFNIQQFLIPAALLMGMLLLGIRRWELPRGFITLTMIVQTALMFWLRNQYVIDYKWVLIAPIAAGVVGDALLIWLKPSSERVWALRLFAFALPVVLYLLYFTLLITQYGTYWAIHMWLGVTVISGAVGLFLSYLSVPPTLKIEEE